MKKILIFSFFCLLCFTTSFAQKVKPVNYGGSVNLMEVRGRGGDAVVVLRTLGYGMDIFLSKCHLPRNQQYKLIHRIFPIK